MTILRERWSLPVKSCDVINSNLIHWDLLIWETEMGKLGKSNFIIISSKPFKTAQPFFNEGCQSSKFSFQIFIKILCTVLSLLRASVAMPTDGIFLDTVGREEAPGRKCLGDFWPPDTPPLVLYYCSPCRGSGWNRKLINAEFIKRCFIIISYWANQVLALLARCSRNLFISESDLDLSPMVCSEWWKFSEKSLFAASTVWTRALSPWWIIIF